MTAIKDCKNFKDNSYLFLMLGPQCNMFCRHCSQMPYKVCKDFIKGDVMSEDVRQLIGSYITYYQNRQGKFKPALICFWGGEALLHWDFIKETVKYFTYKYNMLNNVNVSFCIPSNGLLVSEEMVEFCNEYRVQFNLSFDAPYPFAVRGFIPEETIARIKKMKHLCVLGSLNALNCDLYAALRCMYEKFNTVAYQMFFNFQLLYTFEMPKDIAQFDFEKIKKGIKMCRIAIQCGNPWYGEAIFPLIESMKNPTLRNFQHTYHLRHCVAGFKYLAVTLDGRMVRCHNDASIQIGTVNESLEDIFKHALEISYKIQGKNQTEKCSKCEHNDICPGGCMMGVKDKDDCYKACDMYIRPIFKILKEEIVKLGYDLTEDDKEWYNKNRLEYEQLAKDYASGKYYNNKNLN